MLCCFLFGVSRCNDVRLLIVAELCDWFRNYLQFIEEFVQSTFDVAKKGDLCITLHLIEIKCEI